MSKSPDDWFAALPDDQRPLLEELRRLLLATNGDFEEAIKWGQPCYSLDSLVCFLNKRKAHVVLGFQQGAHLDDPRGLLEGTGKDMRHIKIRTAEDIDKPAFQALIEEAVRFDRAG